MNDKLPKVLVVALESILDDHVLSSWQFKGGPLYTQLTIRFAQGDMTANVEDMKYRRIPHSQILREKTRVKNFKDKKGHNTFQTQENFQSKNENDKDVCSTTDTLNNIDSPTVSNKATADENVTEEFGLETNIGVIAAGDISRPVEAIPDQGGQHLSAHNNVNAAPKQERGGIIDTDDDSNSDDEFSCDGCGCMMSGDPGTKWFRCTECGDLDICESCHQDDFHKEHRSYISGFTCPKNLDDPWCDACGKMFRMHDNNAILHQCQICEDYILCSVCKRQSFHNIHKTSLKTLHVQEYIDLC